MQLAFINNLLRHNKIKSRIVFIKESQRTLVHPPHPPPAVSHLHIEREVGAVQQGHFTLHDLHLLHSSQRRPGQTTGGWPVGYLVLLLLLLKKKEDRRHVTVMFWIMNLYVQLLFSLCLWYVSTFISLCEWHSHWKYNAFRLNVFTDQKRKSTSRSQFLYPTASHCPKCQFLNVVVFDKTTSSVTCPEPKNRDLDPEWM